MEPRTKKILWGCAIGCGGLIVLFVVAVTSFVVWIRQPGELLEPGRLVGEDTIGYAEWTLSLEDPGTQQFVEELLDALQEQQQQTSAALPGPLAAFAQWQQRRDREKFRDLFPMVAAWTLSRGDEPGERHHLFSLSLERVGNGMVFADWVMGLAVPAQDDDLIQVPHLDERIYTAPGRPEPFTFFLRGNDLFFTRSLATAKDAVERLQPRPQGSRPPARIDELLARVPAGRSLRGALTNEAGEIYALWDRFALAPGDPDRLRQTASRLRGAVVSGGLRGEQTFEGEIALQAPDAAWATEFAEDSLARFRQGLAYEGVDLGADARTDRDWIVIRFRITGSLEPLQRLFESSLRDAVRNLPEDAVR
jgi:hypothetical protein